MGIILTVPISEVFQKDEMRSDMPQCKTEKHVLEVFLREGLLTLPSLPDPQILSTLS